MTLPSESELSEEIEKAARAALLALRAAHPEDFYYITLFTSGECLPPQISAWSHEALKRVEVERGKDAAALVKWSHADSPYHAFGEPCFENVKRLFDARPDPHGLGSEEFEAECALRLRAMESAMAQLDRQGCFGVGTARLNVVVLVEVFPPDRGNVERALRLNPPGALREWLVEAAEA